MKWLYDNRSVILRDFRLCLALIISSIVLFSAWAFLDVQGALRPFDVAVLTAFADGRSEEVKIAKYSEIMRDITSIGGTALITLVTTSAVLGLWLLRQKGKAGFVTLTVATSSILNNTLKTFFDLPRPDIFPHGTIVHSMAFPSGHTFTGTVTYLTLAFLVYQLPVRPQLKIFAFCLAVLISFWVGISRLYLGVHWPSDVIGSWILAIGWCSFCWMIWLVSCRMERELKEAL